MTRLSKLQMIQKPVQEIGEAIASALRLEVEIFDDNLVVVGATGRIRGKIGFKQETANVTRKVLETGNSFAIEEPGKHILCRNCTIKTNCFCTAALVCPISLSGKIVGTISLLSFDEPQKEELISRQNQYFDFMSRMGELIASRAQLLEIMDNITSSERYLKTIIDSVSEGIIAVDAEGYISYVNNVVERLFNYRREDMIGQPVTDFFPGSPLPETLHNRMKFTDQEIEVGINDIMVKLICSTAPIFMGNEIVGAVKTFKDVRRLSKVAVKILQDHENITFEDIRGTSEAITHLKEQANIVAAGNSTILLRGESGTGKELFARAIHQASPCRNGPFQAINCSAIPETLLESELFGYEEGAFTGARKGGKPGKFELADGGTLFLDEIGDMPLTLQAKLLRVLESNRLERIGGNKEYSFNVRLIAATNRNLEEMVEKNQFRSDLYYRLNVIPLFIPSLRDRKEDILYLAEFFLEQFGHLLRKPILGLDPEVKAILMSYHWPGNVRELENVIEYAVNFERSSLISVKSLPQWIIQRCSGGNNEVSLKHRSAELESEIIRKMIEEMGDSVKTKKAIAEQLGISLTTLYRKLKYMN
ncbi:MAG TPA: sigma 54-interacting transcriptional regulator [Bacillota bacterium]|jgi:PAS domain S-box-containing protein|nr:sigma 54-interacting transcriptional regulator [Bacillota bacterium]HOL15699.1 sigma 54-interacting transcriptional regulator [Bacillota bacterium]